MIDLTFDLQTGVARLAAPAIVKAGATVPVRVTFSEAPGEETTLELALGTDAATPVVLAQVEDGDWTQENDTQWTALVDLTDAAVATALSGKSLIVVAGEVVATVDGNRLVSPNFAVTLQQRIIPAPTP